MKKLLLVAILAAAATALACGEGSKESSPAAVSPAASAGGPKKAAIYFTKNHDKGTGPGQYNTDCIGVISPDQIYGDKNQKITWKIKMNNGESDDDKCENLDVAQVNLRFDTNVVKAAKVGAMNGEIEATVSNDEGDYNSMKRQKYQVYIGDDAAGPDPIIIVNCGSCGPGGGPGD